MRVVGRVQSRCLQMDIVRMTLGTSFRLATLENNVKLSFQNRQPWLNQFHHLSVVFACFMDKTIIDALQPIASSRHQLFQILLAWPFVLALSSPAVQAGGLIALIPSVPTQLGWWRVAGNFQDENECEYNFRNDCHKYTQCFNEAPPAFYPCRYR